MQDHNSHYNAFSRLPNSCGGTIPVKLLKEFI